jgi:CheY-like chemotaxis protein
MWLDPAVLELLLELAFHWAVGIGRLVQVRVAFARDTLRPDLLFTVREPHDPAWREHIQGESEFNDLPWLLIRLLGQSQLLDPQRILMDNSVMLMLRFPAPVEEVGGEGVTASELPQPEIERGAMAGGCHVVVVEPDSNLRLVIRQTLHDAGMQVETFAAPREAEDLSAHFVAEAVVSGVPPDSPDMLSLVAVLRQKNPAVRVIQLTDDDFLYIGEDNATEAARVGRASVRQALVQAILLAVGVFAPPTMASRR